MDDGRQRKRYKSQPPAVRRRFDTAKRSKLLHGAFGQDSLNSRTLD